MVASQVVRAVSFCPDAAGKRPDYLPKMSRGLGRIGHGKELNPPLR